MQLGMVRIDGAPRFALLDRDDVRLEATPDLLPTDMDEALTLRLDDLRDRVDRATRGSLRSIRRRAADALAPLGTEQEVWAAGVTYWRSLEARTAESDQRSVYDLVYEAERPELFFKALPRRVAGPGEDVGIRADSTWNVPEPELTLAVNAHAEIVGYTLGNDVSSRSIEGANPLYLPQAKSYERSCAIGPAIAPAWEVPDPRGLTISLTIRRRGTPAYAAEVSVGAMRRGLQDLVDHLFTALRFPHGVFLLTGTGIVPPDDFTLEPDDEVRIAADPIGELVNTVVVIEAMQRR
jgi:2-dehydro-3-deoxy-D-arabinonate dehydratase